MCTAHAKASSDDGSGGDIWADSSDDGQGADHRELDREATARHQHFYNAGYRDGLEEGKEQTLQEGFNIGFREGAAAGYEWGRLRGAAKTLGALDGQASGTRGLRDQIQALQAAAEVPPRAAMLAILRHVLVSEPSQPSQPPQPPPPPPPPPQQQNEYEPQPLQLPPEVPDPLQCAASAAAAAVQRCSLVGGVTPADHPPTPGVSAGSSDPAAAHDVVLQQLKSDFPHLEVVTPAPARRALADAAAASEPAAASGASRVQPAGGPPTCAGSESRPASNTVTSAPAPAGSTHTVPPGAATLDLPDMPRVMTDVRLRLSAMGFDLGTAK